MSENHKKCVGRTPLRYGSKQCEKPATKHSDLCAEHAAMIEPHHARILINTLNQLPVKVKVRHVARRRSRRLQLVDDAAYAEFKKAFR